MQYTQYGQAPTHTQMIHPNAPRILISHSSLDKEFCDTFVELLALIGFTNKTIIYTSRSEFGIPIGNDIYDYLRNHLRRKIWVFFMLSKNFYESPACLNEMGAAWIRQNRCCSVLLPGFSHGDIKGVANRNEHTLDLRDPVRLTELLDLLRRTWSLPVNNTRWAAIQQDFIGKITRFYG